MLLVWNIWKSFWRVCLVFCFFYCVEGSANRELLDWVRDQRSGRVGFLWRFRPPNHGILKLDRSIYGRSQERVQLFDLVPEPLLGALAMVETSPGEAYVGRILGFDDKHIQLNIDGVGIEFNRDQLFRVTKNNHFQFGTYEIWLQSLFDSFISSSTPQNLHRVRQMDGNRRALGTAENILEQDELEGEIIAPTPRKDLVVALFVGGNLALAGYNAQTMTLIPRQFLLEDQEGLLASDIHVDGDLIEVILIAGIKKTWSIQQELRRSALARAGIAEGNERNCQALF